MLTLLGLAAVLATQAPDTTFAVERTQRLDVNLHAGSVTVRTWNRDQAQVRATDGDSRNVTVRARRERIGVELTGRWGAPSDADLELTIPGWLPIQVNGVDLDVTIEGAAAPVTVETVQGDVRVTGGRDIVTLTSVEGTVRLQGASGRIRVHSVNDDVTVVDVQGDVTAETVNGDVLLRGVRSPSVEATTVNGDISFEGPFASGGRYGFTTHNGDITVAVPEGTSAVVSVATFGGSFEAGFPVTVSNIRQGQRFSFTLGGGAARLELESFQGAIRLARPAAMRGSN